MSTSNINYYEVLSKVQNLLSPNLPFIHQATIDHFESVEEALNECIEGISYPEPLLNEIEYHTVNLIDICDESLHDYKVLQELKIIISEYL